MVHESLQHMNSPIQLVGNVIPGGTTRFSAKGKEGLSIVHISFYQRNRQILCTDGHCSINCKNKNITCRNPDHQYMQVCSHLHTIFVNLDSVKGFFPDFFLQEEGHLSVIPEGPVNKDDVNIECQASGKFNIETGLWDYPALSKHKPKEMMDLQLVNSTLECNEITSSKKLNTSTGLYSSFICKPSPFNPDGTPKPCMCGHTYVEGSALIKNGTLFTRLGPVEVEYHETLCSAGEYKLPFTLGAEEESIFLKTSFTAAGDR